MKLPQIENIFEYMDMRTDLIRRGCRTCWALVCLWEVVSDFFCQAFFFFFPSLLTTLFLSQAPSFLDFVLIFTPYHPGMKVHKQARSCVAAWLLVGSTNYRSMHAHFSTMPNERVTGKRSKHIFPQRSSVNHHYQFMN